MNNKRFIRILIVLVVALLALMFSGCSQNRRRKAMPLEQKMELADNLFERGKFNRAAELYLDVVFERSSRYTPTAQFKLAESYFNMSRYAEAVFEYRELIRLFPEHTNAKLAYFRIGESNVKMSLSPHYSQEETIAAIDAFEVFLDRYPFDEKKDLAVEYIREAQYRLLEKKYLNGYIYYKLYDYSAALMYFDEIITLGNRDNLDRMSRYYTALIFSHRKEREQMEQMMQSLISYYPGSTETGRVRRTFARTFR